MADALAVRLEYEDFLRSKDFSAKPCGFDVPLSRIKKALRADGFEWSAAIVRWGLKRGKAAFFEDCGMTKTTQGMEWSRHVSLHTGLPVLCFAPLCVAEQTALEEAPKFGYKVNLCESQSDIKPGINITNYEKRHKFSPEGLGGISCGNIDDATRYSIEVWQRYASPVWMDINPSRTLNRDGAREAADERHICPLQLDVIERAIDLWTNPGDLVLSPFMGIGSEGYVAVQRGRCFIGIELKPSYFKQALLNLKAAETTQAGLFASVEPSEMKA